MQSGTFFIAIMASITSSVNCPAPANNDVLSTGIYSSYADFASGRLTWAAGCNNGKDKLHINSFLGSPKGYVLLNGEKHVFYKNQVYGYHDCTNHDFRFYNNDIYQLVDTAGFYIYYRYQTETGPSGKGNIKADRYYFSVKGDAAIEPLTITNLKKAYPGNLRFYNEIDVLAQSGGGLMAYDHQAKMYKIKCLFSQSFK
jgi:hypothetical protein